MSQPAILVSCEHGGNNVPRPYAFLFEKKKGLLASHRAYDKGAMELASTIAGRLGAVLITSRTTRLLVDLNRSVHHPRLFSSHIRALPEVDRERILQRYYTPYRDSVQTHVSRLAALERCVLHVSVHTFAPVRTGQVRRCDVGLLYDPARCSEKLLACAWQSALSKAPIGLHIRRNYPYRGVSDGLTSTLRTRLAPESYLGIEIEVNQRLTRRTQASWAAVQGAIAHGLAEALTNPDAAFFPAPVSSS